MKENKNDIKEIKRYKLILNVYKDCITTEVIEQKPFKIDKSKKKKNDLTKSV